MKNNMIALVGAGLLLAGPALAGGLQSQQPVAPSVTTDEGGRLQNLVAFDKMVVENPAFLGGGSMAARKAEAERNLAEDQTTLDEFKTAGPDAGRRKAIEMAKSDLENPGHGAVQQILAIQGIKEQAQRELTELQGK